MGATFTHLLLWNRDDMKAAWDWMNPTSIKRIWANFNWRFWKEDGMRSQNVPDDTDPHYREMLKASLFLGSDTMLAHGAEYIIQYPDAPNSWYVVTLVIAIVIALVVIYKTNSTLPW